jgi:hypothetical protein
MEGTFMNLSPRFLRSAVLLMLSALLAGFVGAADVQAQNKPNPPRTQQAGVSINGSPLTITVQNTLGMEVYYDGAQQFYARDAGGTFLEVDGVVYGDIPPANNGFQPVAFTPVSNTGPTGSGTAADPFKIVTVVTAGATGVRLTQTTTYVQGDAIYTIDVALSNTSGASRAAKIIHGADLYLNFVGNRPDFGYGFYDEDSGAVGALSEDGQSAQVFIPVTPADAYQEAFYALFWRRIGIEGGVAGPGLNNTINSSFHDTAAGLQYNRTLAAGGTASVTFQGGFGSLSDIPINPPEEEIDTTPPAFITVVSRASPNITVIRGGIVTYTVVITNRGRGRARNVIINMPFRRSAVTVLDATFSNSTTAWVSELRGDGLTIRTGPVAGGGAIVIATIRVRVNDTVVNGTAVADRISFEWDDNGDDGLGSTNVPILVVGDSNRNETNYSFVVSPQSGPVGQTRSFESNIFAPGEPVALWINTPDGRNVPLDDLADDDDDDSDQFTADEDGVLAIDITLSDFAPGSYTVVAYGTWTEFTATGALIIQ